MWSTPDWTHRSEYIATRSVRRRGDTDIQPGWADEAYSDPAALGYDPDYASKTGKSVRTIGYSASAGFLITVITVTEHSHLWGVNAWRSNTKDERDYNAR